MEKTLKFEEGVKMMNAIAFCFTREYYENTGQEPSCEQIEEYTKRRFQEYCDIEGIMYIED